MNRLIAASCVLLLFSPAAAAQDMPLSQILIDSEGWDKAEGKPAPRFVSSPLLTQSPDGSTVFRWAPASGRFIEARQAGAPESVPYAPYCPIRPGPKGMADVTALTVDKDGRIYAATPPGIQVFDPTGRLCGVITSPGRVDLLAFEGDRLTAWVGDTKYTRKLKTTGVK